MFPFPIATRVAVEVAVQAAACGERDRGSTGVSKPPRVRWRGHHANGPGTSGPRLCEVREFPAGRVALHPSPRVHAALSGDLEWTNRRFGRLPLGPACRLCDTARAVPLHAAACTARRRRTSRSGVLFERAVNVRFSVTSGRVCCRPTIAGEAGGFANPPGAAEQHIGQRLMLGVDWMAEPARELVGRTVSLWRRRRFRVVFSAAFAWL